jgi:hypothetical protein
MAFATDTLVRVPCPCCDTPVPSWEVTASYCADCRELPHATRLSLAHQARMARALEGLLTACERVEDSLTTLGMLVERLGRA